MTAQLDQVCALCGSRSSFISATLGVCGRCARTHRDQTLLRAAMAHAASRRTFGLPEVPPCTPGGVRCSICARECRVGEAERGYCGLRIVRDGRLVHLAGTPERGLLSWYRDPLPTNCVADWVCAGHRQAGWHNLAVAYESCSSDCLFCQNWRFRETSLDAGLGVSASELAEAANRRTFCVCFFGGDPAPQMPHALAAARDLADRGVVICWETAGAIHNKLLDQAVDLSLKTGGCIKFDLKAYDDTLHQALTGVSNRPTLESFRRAAERLGERPGPPLVVASTLLIPGYVDAEEVGRLAEFIAEQDPEIPYSLLGFAPHFCMADLPRTSLRHAEAARVAARSAGLRNVRTANQHLLLREC